MTDTAAPFTGNGPGPFSAMLGFRAVHVDAESVVLEADPRAEHLNGGGIVHGGYLSALLDTATGHAVHARVPEGVVAPHVQLTVQYVRAAMAGETLVCRARAVNVGRRIGSTEAEITQGEWVIARAIATHAVIA